MQQLISRRNPVSVHLKKLGASKRYREETGRFLCDGMKLLEEAIGSDARITTILTSVPLPFPLPTNTRVYYATKDIVDSISPLKNAQAVLFECEIPNEGQRVPQIDIGSTCILLDGLQDPGNVGSIVRTAHAFGIEAVLLHGDCADLYNPRTIRATMGAVFKQRVYHTDADEIAAIKESGIRLIGTAPHGNGKDVSKLDLRGSIIAIGSEGGGLSDGILSLCDDIISIPTVPQCESLGAAIAAAIIMYNVGMN
jgi:TrmH family RNA methyltransferase